MMELSIGMKEQQPQKKEKKKKETHIQKQTGARLLHLSRLAQVVSHRHV